MTEPVSLSFLEEKAAMVWRKTIALHGLAPETRLASSLSPVEIFVCLYYGGIIRYNAASPMDDSRDRVIISKGHGSVSMYPILADTGFFPEKELENICRKGSILGGIPDPVIPGYETVNGSLGHGPGVGCGIAVGLKAKSLDSRVFVMCGDGELYEGAVWEAVMFAAHHKLNNLVLIVDNNKISMLDYCRNIVDIEPLEKKFQAFGWDSAVIENGNSISETYPALLNLTEKQRKSERPLAIIANTVKGRGIPELETNSLCHVMSLKKERVNEILGNDSTV